MIHLALINVPPQKCSPRSFMDTIHGYSPTWASTPLTTLPLRIFCWPHSTSATKISIQRLLQIISTHWRSDRPDGTFCLTVHQTDFSCLITVEEGVHRWAEKYKSNQCDKSFHFVDVSVGALQRRIRSRRKRVGLALTESINWYRRGVDRSFL